MASATASDHAKQSTDESLTTNRLMSQANGYDDERYERAADEAMASCIAVTAKATTKQERRASQLQKPAEVQPINGAALLETTFPHLVWILEGLIPEGTILLAGKPKSGKSWFALNLLVACALAAKFLGKASTKCSGLYLALEDTPRRLKSRLAKLAVLYQGREDELANLEFVCDWPRGTYGAEKLDAHLRQNPDLKLVIIDVLAKIRPVTNRQSNAYELDYEAIATWKKVADRHRISLLIVHHTRKAEADDVYDEISGTLGLIGAVDQVIVLKTVVGPEKQATLHLRGRDLPEDHELGLQFRDGWWEHVGRANHVSANRARRGILNAIADAGGTASTKQLMDATGKSSRPSLSRLLGSMIEDGLIERDGQRFRLAPID